MTQFVTVNYHFSSSKEKNNFFHWNLDASYSDLYIVAYFTQWSTLTVCYMRCSMLYDYVNILCIQMPEAFFYTSPTEKSFFFRK
jgi:hypothetical protein